MVSAPSAGLHGEGTSTGAESTMTILREIDDLEKIGPKGPFGVEKIENFYKSNFGTREPQIAVIQCVCAIYLKNGQNINHHSL